MSLSAITVKMIDYIKYHNTTSLEASFVISGQFPLFEKPNMLFVHNFSLAKSIFGCLTYVKQKLPAELLENTNFEIKTIHHEDIDNINKNIDPISWVKSKIQLLSYHETKQFLKENQLDIALNSYKNAIKHKQYWSNLGIPFHFAFIYFALFYNSNKKDVNFEEWVVEKTIHNYEFLISIEKITT